MKPYFSPLMLKAFLHVRVDFAVRTALRDGFDMVKAEREAIRNRAGVSKTEFWEAWQGRLKAVSPRLKQWAALDLVPGDHGVMLTEDD